MRVFEFESELKMMVEEVASGMEYFDRRASFLVIPSGPADANDGNDHVQLSGICWSCGTCQHVLSSACLLNDT